MNWHPVDLVLVLGYFASVLTLGLWMSRRSRSREDYLVGGRRVPAVAVLGSLVATEVSAATFLAVPGVGFSENMAYLQFGIGSIAARFFIAWLFLRAFFAGAYVSIYEYLRDRFGERTQKTASLYFIGTRLLASGVRLMIAVTGVSVILGIPFEYCLLAFLILTVVYTSAGGIRAVIWTDCIQAIVFLGAGFGALLYLGQEIGWSQLLETGREAGRWQVFVWEADPGQSWWNQGNWWLTAILFGFLSTSASLGTDQDLAQRLLASRSRKSASRSLILSGFVAVPVAALFLVVGVALFSAQTLSPDPDFPMQLVNGERVADGDEAFSHFIKTLALPGLKGLLLAGVLAAAMSSLDSAMAALSASSSTDLALGRERLFTGVFAVLLGLIAWLLRDAATFLWLVFQITALTYGPLLGIYLVGLLSGRGADRWNPPAMIFSTLVCLALLIGIKQEIVDLAWTWLLPLGAGLTFGISMVSGKRPPCL